MIGRRRGPPASYEFTTSSSVWADRLLELVGGALAAAPRDQALFVARRGDAPSTRLIARDAEFAGAIRRAAQEVPGSLLRAPRAAASDGAERPLSSLAYLVRTEEPERPRWGERELPGSSRVPRDPGGASVSASPMEVQSHWFPTGDGRLRVWTRLAVRSDAIASPSLLSLGLERARELGARGAGPVRVVAGRSGRAEQREWRSGALAHARRGPPLLLAPSAVPALLPPIPAGRFPTTASLLRQTVVLGSTGSGKTTWLARLAVARIRAGGSVLLFDVHGDLAPRVVGGLRKGELRRVLAVDATLAPNRIPGLAFLEPDRSTSPGASAADAVAALKRLAPDGQEIYWGFRLERVFDTFVRIVLEEGGGLLDLLDLLTDERRREAARWTTRRPEVARFLDELPAILRRQPEFLWPAASRLSKLALVPALGALLSPTSGRIPLNEWLEAGGSVLWRLPFSELGPEGSALAATLLATRSYLSVARGSPASRGRRPTMFLFDEAHAISPRLLTEILSEGRKFAVSAVVATQYPERLAPELRAAAAGAAGAHVVFRVPVASSRTAAAWLGMPPEVAERELPALPIGEARWVCAGVGRGRLQVAPLPPPRPGGWDEARRVSSERFGAGADGSGEPSLPEDTERVLFGLFELECRGERATIASLGALVAEEEPRPVRPEDPAMRVRELVGRGWVVDRDGTLSLGPAGHRALGIGGATGAVRESAEHRALLLEAVRIFARHGARLEIVRQGRFDQRLPDGLVRQVPPALVRGPPARLFEELERRRPRWLWRYFGGQDVFVEAEVSGAERSARIRHGASKAERAGAFALFLVSNGRRAARVRRVLNDRGVAPGGSGVWTLRAAAPSPEVPSAPTA